MKKVKWLESWEPISGWDYNGRPGVGAKSIGITMISKDWIDVAEKRLSKKIIQTPCTYDPDINAYLKWENHQETGSFKLRGALNKVLALEPWEQERGLVAASAGNHGLGVAYAARLVGTKAVVFIPENSVH